MKEEILQAAASAFMGEGKQLTIQPLGQGLIHFTCKVTDPSTKKSIVLQAINKNVFRQPEDIVDNYQKVYDYLRKTNQPSIPEPIYTISRQLMFIDNAGNYWRATAFIDNSYSPMTAANSADAETVARIFGGFTRSLAGMDMTSLKEIIPSFHHLAYRYEQLAQAINGASLERLLKATHVIAEFRHRKYLVDFFEQILKDPAYPYRVMHHDCKISNILFDQTSGEVICPVDLDTLMPGKFFSDLGDMIRSMCCSEDENSIQWELIRINPDYYNSILKGYLEGTGELFSSAEKKHIHYAGLIMIYMQGIRFLADFLNGDIYYKMNYAEQNLNRALNQLILLEQLEKFLESTFAFKAG